MVGGRDYVDSIYNRATQAERQPGSAFKLFVYLAALESGMKPTDTIVDEPVTIDGWTPRNSTRTNVGPVSLREAFSRSINTISAKIGAQLGFGTIADMARRFGISSKISTFPSMVLGTSDVRLIDMTRAFASVGNQGVSVTPYAIRKVVTADGQLLYQHQATEEGRVLVAPWVAAEMTDLLQSAVLTGTGRAAQIGRPVAGKTGTTSSNKDGWFIGFSSGLTTGVWMGRDDARPIAGLQGGTAPARAFHDFMTVAVARRPVEQFETEVPMPDWQLEPRGGSLGRRTRSGSSRWSTRTAIRCPASRPTRSRPGPCSPAGTAAGDDGPARSAMARPGPAAAAARSVSRLRASRNQDRRWSGRRRRPHRVRPIRFSRGPNPRSNSRAASRRRRSNSLRSSALNARPWSMWTRCATSCATTYRRGVRRREDQPPAVADRAADAEQLPQRVSASPTRYRAQRDAGALGDLRRFARQDVASARRLRKRLDRGAQSPLRARRSAARRRPAAACAGPLRSHTQRDVAALDRDRRARREGLAGSIAAELRLDPFALLGRPVERRLAAHPQRAGQLQHAASLVEPQAQAPRAAQRADLAPARASPRGEARPQSGRSTT